jgi:hypothetical protein
MIFAVVKIASAMALSIAGEGLPSHAAILRAAASAGEGVARLQPR